MSSSSVLATASLRVRQNADHATLIFLTAAGYSDLFSSPIHVKYSLGDGVFCASRDRTPITADSLSLLESRVRLLISGGSTLEEVRIPRDDLFGIFKSHGQSDKIGVLKSIPDHLIKCIRLGSFVDYVLEPMQLDLTQLPSFEFRLYQYGFLLRFPRLLAPDVVGKWRDPRPQYEMFDEYDRWGRLVGIETVGQLNHLIYRRQLTDLKWVSEGLHERKLAQIAAALVRSFESRPIVTISGPSSSNKTTFAKRLAISLRVRGFRSLVIEMDDYFIDREATPFGPDGLRDYEAITALNVALLSERVARLLSGESVPRRRYDFKDGIGYDVDGETQQLGPKCFLILEGIHGLNPALLEGLGRARTVPIYVAALTALAIDSTHRFPSSDLRLLRRIVRDHNYRGASARRTIRRWTSVRVGEEKNIFPLLGNAELFFNSALAYEVPVLQVFARSLLAEATVPEEGEDNEDPMTVEITREARRLLGMITLFYPVSLEEVPHISCIREFVGGSDLDY